jgi:cysteine desulfurase
MGQFVGPNSVRPWTSAAGPYIGFPARERVAELIGAHSLDIIFTSCGTESNNTAIAAALRANPTKRHIVTSQVEHSSVLNYCMALEKTPLLGEEGLGGGPYRVTYLPVDRDGFLLAVVFLIADN